MPLRVPVKVSDIDNLTEARYYAGAEVQWLGFCLEPAHPRYIGPDKVAAIREWIIGPQFVGRFEHQPLDTVNQWARELKLDYVEVPAARLEEDFNTPVIARWEVKENDRPKALAKRLRQQKDRYRYVQLSFRQQKWIPAELMDAGWLSLTGELPVILDISLHAKEADKLIDHMDVGGLNLQAAGEQQTGLKSFEEVADLLEALKAEA